MLDVREANYVSCMGSLDRRHGAREAHGTGVTRCYTESVPTKRRRHAVTETPPVEAALDELRREIGDGRIEFGELVILGAQEKLARVRSERAGAAALRRRLSERIRAREAVVDLVAAEEVRRSGWARP
jgi:hypothetical protein